MKDYLSIHPLRGRINHHPFSLRFLPLRASHLGLRRRIFPRRLFNNDNLICRSILIREQGIVEFYSHLSLMLVPGGLFLILQLPAKSRGRFLDFWAGICTYRRNPRRIAAPSNNHADLIGKRSPRQEVESKDREEPWEGFS
jgi:hypothetical protein